MMHSKKQAVLFFTLFALTGCGEPPIAVPAGAPGTDATLVPPETSAEDAPAALGESRTIIKKEQEQQKQENQALAKMREPGEAEKAGLKIEILQEGKGEGAQNGQTLKLHYTGTFQDGKKFDSSRDRKQPFQFKLGQSEVIMGWELGLLGMKPGERRKLTIPPLLAYGERGRPDIPPNSTLLFDVELLEIK